MNLIRRLFQKWLTWCRLAELRAYANESDSLAEFYEARECPTIARNCRRAAVRARYYADKLAADPLAVIPEINAVRTS